MAKLEEAKRDADEEFERVKREGEEYFLELEAQREGLNEEWSGQIQQRDDDLLAAREDFQNMVDEMDAAIEALVIIYIF